MAVVDQHRLHVGMLETFARFLGHGRSVAARMSGCKVTGGNTDSLGGVWGVDWLSPQAYNVSVILCALQAHMSELRCQLRHVHGARRQHRNRARHHRMKRIALPWEDRQHGHHS